MNEAQKTSSDLTISTEFKSLIRELSHSELSELESSIKEFGCLSPIVVWSSRNIILDGHNRYDICKRNNIEFKTTNLEFLNENDAKMWLIKNQFSRRNLSAYERSILALQLETIIKEKAKENQLSGLKQNTVQQNSDKREKEVIDTNKYLSKFAGVSHDTIARVRKIEECADEATKESLLKSKMSINEAYEKIKKENLKKSITKIENPADESEKYDVIYSHYYELSKKTKSEILSIVNENSTLLLWSTQRNLQDSILLIKKLGFQYTTCLVWDKMDEKKSFNILLIAVLKNPDVVQQKVTCIYSEPVPEKSKEPKYYLDLIEKWFPNKKIHIL